MKILRVQTNNLSFEAGKIHMFSDFDGTYCPAKHREMHDPTKNEFMFDYCKKMNDFFKLTKGNVHFHITTGRTFGEYEAVSYLLKMRNFRLPLPETLITKNGSDEFIREGNSTDFYTNGVFPFDYNKPNDSKNLKFKQNNNWDGKSIDKYLKELCEKYYLRIVEGETENSVSDYGDKSLFSEGKLNADDWKRLPNDNKNIFIHETPIADYSIGIRKDGELKKHLTFSPDYGFCPERNYIYDNFVNEIKKYLSTNNTKYVMNWEEASQKNFHRISCNITPKFENKELTKLYDTKEALKEAIRNNDIVVVAGDGSNDFEMLNPLEYIDKDFIKECEKKSNDKTFYKKDMKGKLADLQEIYSNKTSASPYIINLKNELSQNGLLQKIDDLPLYSIVIKKDKSKLKQLVETFQSTNKVIIVDSGDLDKGIKQAIINHSKKNKEFKDNLSENIKNKILGIKKNNNISKYILGSLVILSIGLITLNQNIRNRIKGKGYEISNKFLQNKQPTKTNDFQVNFYG